jgi:hypothetical protein
VDYDIYVSFFGIKLTVSVLAVGQNGTITIVHNTKMMKFVYIEDFH